MTDAHGWTVSYRMRWWQRRLYVCGNVTRQEADDMFFWLRRNGYRSVRIQQA